MERAIDRKKAIEEVKDRQAMGICKVIIPTKSHFDKDRDSEKK